MIIYINGVIILGLIFSCVERIIEGDILSFLLLFIFMIIMILNNICIISKNKHIYNLEQSYFKFIRQVSIFEKEKEFNELKIYIENARKTKFYKMLRKENSELPMLENIYDWHGQDRV